MAEIVPTPRAGTVLRIDPQGSPWTPQPRAGTVLRIDPQGSPWTPQPRRHGRLYGLGRGTRSVH